MENEVRSDVRQYVVFRLGEQEYGVDTLKVTIIEHMRPVTRVPKTPDYIKGVINLRGEIIPIMDMRKKFNLPPVEETEDTRVIIVEVEDISVGMIVDGVAEVLHLSDDMVESLNSFSGDLSLDYIIGAGKVDNRLVTLLNIEKLIKIS